ncbi:MAG: hypothetical protein RR490_02395 [Niameybacter sp.]
MRRNNEAKGIPSEGLLTACVVLGGIALAIRMKHNQPDTEAQLERGDKIDEVNAVSEQNTCHQPEEEDTLPNPVQPFTTIEILQAQLPFTLKQPHALEEDTVSGLEIIDEKLVQVTYTSPQDTIGYRMGEGTNDISGDYTVYPLEIEVDSKWDEVTLKGNSDAIYLARWTDGTYSYAISSREGMSESTILEIIESIE